MSVSSIDKAIPELTSSNGYIWLEKTKYYAMFQGIWLKISVPRPPYLLPTAPAADRTQRAADQAAWENDTDCLTVDQEFKGAISTPPQILYKALQKW